MNPEERLYKIQTPFGTTEFARGRTKEDALDRSFNGAEYKKQWYLAHCKIRRVYEQKLKSGKVVLK